jgi:hypothetical protein
VGNHSPISALLRPGSPKGERKRPPEPLPNGRGSCYIVYQGETPPRP